MSGNILDCYNSKEGDAFSEIRARDTTKYTTLPGRDPHNKTYSLQNNKCGG
jgi:hypothetical protein